MKHWRVALAVLALGTSSAVIAAPANAPNPSFTGGDLFSISVAADPQISPDGRWIAYVRRSNDVMTDRARSTIWLIDAATGDERPLVTGTGSHSSPRWSHDGKRLAYVSTAEGSSSQLYVRWMDSGQTARITGVAESPQGISWSPDGQRIAYVMNVPDEGPKLGTTPAKPEGAEWAKPLEVIDKVTYRVDGGGYLKPGFDHIFVVDALGGAPRQLTFGAYHDGNPEWTPDGRAILRRVRARRTTWLADRLAHLSDEDRERVEAALPALRRMLEPRP